LRSLTKKKPCHPPVGSWLRAFCFHPSLEQAQFWQKKKDPDMKHQGFLFVDNRVEISNFNLVSDMKIIIRLEKIISTI